MAVHSDTMPPTRNLGKLDEEFRDIAGLDLIAGSGRQRAVQHAISNSFGFGGTNASLVFSKPPSE